MVIIWGVEARRPAVRPAIAFALRRPYLRSAAKSLLRRDQPADVPRQPLQTSYPRSGFDGNAASR